MAYKDTLSSLRLEQHVSISAHLPLRQPGEPREFFSYELRSAQRASSFEVRRIVDLLERREAVVA
eukprot:4178837-Pleurochrysis_carterae.AAC.1